MRFHPIRLKVLRRTYSRLKAFQWPARNIFVLTGACSTLWFLIRVIPKPSRALYPCMRTAAPIMSGFVAWVLSLGTSVIAFKKAEKRVVQGRFAAALGFCLVGLLSTVWFLTGSSSGVRADLQIWYAGNQPVGEGRGIHPGRVAWTHNPEAARWDGQTGFWWEDQFNPQAEYDQLTTESLRLLTGEKNAEAAWDRIFRNYNQRKSGAEAPYREGEKIAIKINQNNTYGHDDSPEINTSPQLLLALLKSLVEQAGVPERQITVFDASRFITDTLFEKCHGAYPEVRFVDHIGGSGRIQAVYVPDAIPYSVDNGRLARGLASCAVEADYLINMAILKGHVGQGVTLCAKNFYGVTSIESDWRRNAHDNFNQNRDGSPRYMTFTDFMGHKDLGEKTLLFMIDAVYGHKFVNDTPSLKWRMAPFNNHWPSSLFISQDGVAIDAVGMDFLIGEFPDAPDMAFCDRYLHESALAGDPPSGTRYDPERDGSSLSSLGVFEHWNNAGEKKYSRNLGRDRGIELLYERMVAPAQ